MPKPQRERAAREIIAARRQAAINFRKMRLSYADIGRRLGVSAKTAHGDVQAALAELQEQTREDSAELVRLELESLDAAAQAIAARVVTGSLGAIDRWIKLSESRRRLLGLDKPVLMATTDAEGNDLPDYDFSNFTDEDLALYEALIAKAARHNRSH